MPNGTLQFAQTTPAIIPPSPTAPEKITPLEEPKPRMIVSQDKALANVSEAQQALRDTERGMEEQAQRVAEFRPEVSVVDYLASQGRPSSFAEREKLAEQAGIADYTGTAEQNLRLLEIAKAQPAPPEPTPEERRREELGKAFRGVFAPEEYERQPYLKRPDETPEEYTARVEALRASGIPEEPEEIEEPPEEITPAAEFTKTIQEMNDRLDREYEDYKSQMNKLATGAIPLTPEEQGQIDTINRIFDDLKRQQITANKNYEAGVNIAGIAAGRQRYAPEIHLGNVKQAVDDGLKKITDLEANRVSAINELKLAIRDKNYKMIGEAYDRFREYTSDKMAALTAIYDVADKERERAYEAVKDQLKTLEDERKRIETEKNKIMSSAAKSGAPASVIAAIGEAESVADAVNVAGEYLETGTGIVGEYLFYKREQESQGLLPVDFNTYQTIDANRKAQAVAAAGSDLTTKEQAVFNRIVDRFNNSPLIKAADRTLALKTISGELKRDKSNSAIQVAFIYALIQALDNYQSAVREGEIRLVEETQGVMDKIINLPDKISKGSVMGNKVVDRYINVAKILTDAIDTAAGKKKKAFQAQAITNSRRIGDAFTSYMGAVEEANNEDIAEDWKDKVDDFVIANPDTAEIAAQMAEDGIKDEDIYEYLINSQ